MKVSKEIKIYVVAVMIVIVSSPLIYWVVQNQMNPPQNAGVEFIGHHEEQPDYIRFWTATQPSSWSGMKTTEKWSFADNPTLETQVKVTSTGSSTFYTEIILVNEGDVDEGFGFQITNSSEGQVRITGWSWIEENETFSPHIDKPINTVLNLTATRIDANQIDYYVDGMLLGTIVTTIPQQEGVMEVEITNGNQGGFAEIYLIQYQVQQET